MTFDRTKYVACCLVQVRKLRSLVKVYDHRTKMLLQWPVRPRVRSFSLLYI